MRENWPFLLSTVLALVIGLAGGWATYPMVFERVSPEISDEGVRLPNVARVYPECDEHYHLNYNTETGKMGCCTIDGKCKWKIQIGSGNLRGGEWRNGAEYEVRLKPRDVRK